MHCQAQEDLSDFETLETCAWKWCSQEGGALKVPSVRGTMRELQGFP